MQSSDDMSFARNLDQTGQHYMIDKSLIRFIVDSAELEKDDVVLEIGYGKGALTKELVKKCKVIAVDIEKNDLDFISGKLQVVQGNILDVFERLYEKHRFNKVVANIPYNISEPLMRSLFKHELDLIVLTVGKNFADILSKKDSRLGIIAGSIYDIDNLKTVKPKSFSPPPRVDSEVIRLDEKTDGKSRTYRMLLSLDDKKLKNALGSILTGKTKRELKALTQDPLFSKRIYELSNREFAELDAFLDHQI